VEVDSHSYSKHTLTQAWLGQETHSHTKTHTGNWIVESKSINGWSGERHRYSTTNRQRLVSVSILCLFLCTSHGLQESFQESMVNWSWVCGPHAFARRFLTVWHRKSAKNWQQVQRSKGPKAKIKLFTFPRLMCLRWETNRDQGPEPIPIWLTTVKVWWSFHAQNCNEAIGPRNHPPQTKNLLTMTIHKIQTRGSHHSHSGEDAPLNWECH
jgi:hypothetical protein